jgi:hypothetical protein
VGERWRWLRAWGVAGRQAWDLSGGCGWSLRVIP